MAKKKSNIVNNVKKKVNSLKKPKEYWDIDKGKVSVKADKTNKKKKSPVKKNKILIVLMFILIGIVGLGLLFFIFIMITSPKFDADKLYDKETTILYDSKGIEFASIGTENRELVTYDQLPQVLVDAIIATEDSRFFQHGGFDLPRFIKATMGQLTGNSAAGGASTLTMQVSKNTFTSLEADGIKGLLRKAQDIYISVFKIEKNYTKEEIMEFYVNSPWLANQSWGIEQACQTYFGKSVTDLNLAEASLMAGMFQAPVAYNPYSNPELATKRRATVLSLMVKHGYITEKEAELANSIDVQSLLVEEKERSFNKYQGFIDTVAEEVMNRTGNNPYKVPMEIWTTMERDSQDVINDLMDGKLHKFVNKSVQSAIALTDVHDGSIRAVGTGRNKTNELEYNLATMMKRHPGSTAKPLMSYGPLLEYNNASSYTPFWDEPMTYTNGQKLQNADRTYLGMLSMKNALVKSRNIPAVQAFQQVDNDKIAKFAHSLGIDYGDHLYESAAIGGFDGVSPLELSAAYAAFARGGYYIEPYSYTKLTYRQTGETIEQKPKREKVMSEETAYIMNFMLTHGGASGVGGKINVKGTDVAAKGGTSTYDANVLKKLGIPSSASADNWIAVYTPDYSMTVWYGYEKLEKGKYVTALAGSSARRSISSKVANRIFKTGSKFNVPSGVVKATVELETFPAMKPSANTPSNLKVTEVFRKGTEPSEVSPRFNTLTNPTNGRYSETAGQVTISWDPAATPDAINNDYLKTFFNKNYGQFATKYYNKRISYNTKNMGTFGYQVYLKSASGSLTNLGFTNDNRFVYNAPSAANLTFVVKSSYSIFKANQSGGLTINASSSSGVVDPDPGGEETPGTEIDRLILNGNSNVCVPVVGAADLWTDEAKPITVISNNVDVTAQSTITATYYRQVSGKWEKMNNRLIYKNAVSNYRITYSISYQGDSGSVSRMVSVKNSC